MKNKNVKLLVWVLLTLLIGFTSCEKKKKTDWEKYNLKGRVKSFTNFTYKAIEKFGEVQKGERVENYFQNFEQFYNKKGFLQKQNSYYYNSLYEENILVYDKKGTKIETNIYNSIGKLKSKNIYKNDTKGNIIEEDEYSDIKGSLKQKNIYKYDKDANLIEHTIYNHKNELETKFILKYNKALIEISNYFSDGSLNWKNTYKYDNRENVMELNVYKFDGSLDYKYTYKYKYDKNGNWIKQISYKNDKLYEIVERKYEYYK